MDPIFTLNAASSADILAYATSLFTDLDILILMVIGLPLGFWLIRKVMSLIRAR